MGGKSVGRYSSVPLPDAFCAKKPNKEEVKGAGREEGRRGGITRRGWRRRRCQEEGRQGVQGGGLDLSF